MIDWGYVLGNVGFLLSGFFVNVCLSFASFFLGSVLGLFFASVVFLHETGPNVKKHDLLNISYYAIKTTTTTLRSLSVLLLALFMFFTLPLVGVTLSSFTIAVFALTLGTSALVAEFLRPAFSATLRTAYEPSLALGCTKSKALFRLVIPYLLRNNVPVFTTVLITVIKDSVIFSVIGVTDISKKASQLIAFDYKVIEVWVSVLLINLLFIQLLIALSHRLERHLLSR